MLARNIVEKKREAIRGKTKIPSYKVKPWRGNKTTQLRGGRRKGNEGLKPGMQKNPGREN